MLRVIFISFLSLFLLFACSKKDNEKVKTEPSDIEIAIAIYEEAVEALKKGDAYYAGKKFKEVEGMALKTEWAAKSSLMAAYADYSRNAYSKSIFALERHIKNYPADKNVAYAHYLIAICYFEQILDEKKDLEPLLLSKEKSRDSTGRSCPLSVCRWRDLAYSQICTLPFSSAEIILWPLLSNAT